MALSSCQFCKLFNTPAGFIDDVILDRKTSEHFMVVADASPVIFSHILIIPREHKRAYAEIDPQLMPEFERVRNKTMQKLQRIGNYVVSGEHGTAGSDLQTSACCEHAHYHMASLHSPTLATAIVAQYEAISKNGSRLATPSEIIQFDGVSYVTVQINDGPTMAYSHYGQFRTQMLRAAMNFSTHDPRLHCYRETRNPVRAELLGKLWPKLRPQRIHA